MIKEKSAKKIQKIWKNYRSRIMLNRIVITMLIINTLLNITIN